VVEKSLSRKTEFLHGFYHGTIIGLGITIGTDWDSDIKIGIWLVSAIVTEIYWFAAYNRKTPSR